MDRVVFRGTPDAVSVIISALPDMLSGKTHDPYGVVEKIKLRAGVALLSQIRQAFIVKSRGGVGNDGIKWPPLSPVTIARRRTTATERKGLGISSQRKAIQRKDGTKTVSETRVLSLAFKKLWDDTYKRVYRKAAQDLEPAAAKRKAESQAWQTVRKAGARSRVQILGSRDVDILRDTGQLIQSFSPGKEDIPSGAEGQIFIVELPGEVTVGSNVKPWHHAGGPNLPARPFWPVDGKLPTVWREAVKRAIIRGVKAAIEEMLKAP